MKRIITFLLAAVLFLLPGCKPEAPVSTGETASAFEGLEIEIFHYERTARERYLHIRWRNHTEYSVLYGEAFDIFRLENDRWIPCPPRENTAFTAIGYSLEPGKEVVQKHEVSWVYDISKPGTYLFSTECFVYVSEYGTPVTLTAEFTVPDPALQTVPEEPPELRLLVGTEVVVPVRGSYGWSWLDEKGEAASVIADAAHPLQMGNLLTLHETTMESARLQFDVQPDKVSVRAWEASFLRDADVSLADRMFASVPLQDDSITLLPCVSKSFIYEITATWEDKGSGSFGTCTYVVHVASYPIEPLT